MSTDGASREMAPRLAAALSREQREQLLGLLMELLEADPVFALEYVRELVTDLAAVRED